MQPTKRTHLEYLASVTRETASLGPIRHYYMRPRYQVWETLQLYQEGSQKKGTKKHVWNERIKQSSRKRTENGDKQSTR